jgi:hypothetical protein
MDILGVPWRRRWEVMRWHYWTDMISFIKTSPFVLVVKAAESF